MISYRIDESYKLFTRNSLIQNNCKIQVAMTGISWCSEMIIIHIIILLKFSYNSEAQLS